MENLNYEIYIMNHPKRKVNPSLLTAIKDMDLEINYHQEINDLRTITVNIMKDFLKFKTTPYLFFFSDDVILGKNFFPAVNYILDRLPKENLYAFYSRKKELRNRKFAIYNFQNHWLTYMYATLISRELAEKLIEHKDDTVKYMRKINTNVDDEYVTSIRRLYKMNYYTPHPSFVQHDCKSPSLLGTKEKYSNGEFRESPSFNPKLDLLEFVKKNSMQRNIL